ncbi:MAG: lipoprotein insertase outer membrane protein LolB [Pseudomonadales bacterium]|nr:lipoprotein insertase outer membrane protein LolB [Pseudomonadales bacterium]
MLLLSACASNRGPETAEQNDSIRWQQHLNEVQKIAGWYVTAKIIIKSADERFSGYLAWQQGQADYEIDFVGPMGAGAMRITGNAEQSLLIIPDKPAYSGSSPEQLLRDNTGYRLPVSQFYYWARGIPNPELPYQPRLNHRGQLKQLRQLDWDLEYSDYQPFNGAVLPGKVVMVSGELEIKLIRLNWQAIDSAVP